MSTRQAVFIVNNIRLIRLLLTIAACLPVLALSVRASGPADAVGDGAKIIASMDSNQLLAAVAICAIAGFCWTQWALSKSLSSIDARLAAMTENLHSRPCVMAGETRRNDK